MFGYVKVFKPQLRICEYEAYKSVYCTLCRTLGRMYGPLSHFILSYDYTFVAMLHMAQNGCEPEFASGRCPFNPLKKCGKCKDGIESFEFAASLSAIMFYYKCVDSIKDSGFFGKTAWGFARLLFAAAHKKAARLFPEIEKTVSKYMERQFEVEREQNVSVDLAADPSAAAMSEILSQFARNGSQRKALADFGYYAGRWIYLIDASDDLDKDIRKASFNPLINAYSLDSSSDEMDVAEARIKANESLNMTLARAMTSYELLELGGFKPIMDNVLQLGMAESQRLAMHEKEL